MTVTRDDALRELEALVGAARVRRDAPSLAAAGGDQTENEPAWPDAVVDVATRDELVAVVKLAARAAVPLVPRVAGTNLGGLTIPGRGGWVLDLTRMNRIVELHVEDMVAVLEPGVSFAQLKQALDEQQTGLTIGFPLAPPEVSVVANCLLDGLGNLSLRHSAMGEWISGLEVIRADGTLLRTGAMALGVPVPFARAPLPDLSGLFVSLQGATGLVSRAAIQLWPAPAFRERSFVFVFDRAALCPALGALARLDVLDDLGALSWPTGKLLLGVIVFGLLAYALWRLFQGLLDPENEGTDAKGIAKTARDEIRMARDKKRVVRTPEDEQMEKLYREQVLNQKPAAEPQAAKPAVVQIEV